MPLTSKRLDPKLTILEQLGHEFLFDTVIPFRDNVFIAGLKMNSGIVPAPLVALRLDFNNQTFTQCTPFHAVFGTRSVAITCGMYIYFLGGKRDAFHLDTAHRYDTVRDQWREIQRMTHCHSGEDCAVSYNDRYICMYSVNTVRNTTCIPTRGPQ